MKTSIQSIPMSPGIADEYEHFCIQLAKAMSALQAMQDLIQTNWHPIDGHTKAVKLIHSLHNGGFSVTFGPLSVTIFERRKESPCTLN